MAQKFIINTEIMVLYSLKPMYQIVTVELSLNLNYLTENDRFNIKVKS